MRKLEIDNFTAILPVTCNANCGFCPEKEMDQKADKRTWLNNLVDHINHSWNLGYDHISLSGGETTLDLRLLEDTLIAIHERTPCRRVGITTNGKFLENLVQTRRLVSFLNDTDAGNMVYFINISRHAFDTSTNNDIMQVNYQHNLGNIAEFRRALKHVDSFRLNMVITAETNTHELFTGALSLTGWFQQNKIDVALRCDYNLDRKEGEVIPSWVTTLFERYFGETRITGGCPTCKTRGTLNSRYRHLMLKGSYFEPTHHDTVSRELIHHQDGVLYYDWQRADRYEPTDNFLVGELMPVSERMRALVDVQEDFAARNVGDVFTSALSSVSYAANVLSATPLIDAAAERSMRRKAEVDAIYAANPRLAAMAEERVRRAYEHIPTTSCGSSGCSGIMDEYQEPSCGGGGCSGHSTSCGSGGC